MAIAAVARFTERRKGRARRQLFTLADFKALGPNALERNLKLSELATLSGFTKDKLLSIIPQHLAAFRVPYHQAYFVTYTEAYRFLKELRLL